MLLVLRETKFWVAGVPAPQGSKIPVSRGGKVVLIEAAKGFQAWRNAVVLASQQDMMNRESNLAFDGALAVNMEFVLVKPPTTKYKVAPAGKPDLDKLVRNTNDGLTKAGLITDDARVTRIDAVKRWGVEGEPSGAWIKITEL